MTIRSGTAVQSAAQPVRLRRVFAGDYRQLSELRRWLTSLLPPGSGREDVLLVATELASNAVKHTASGRGGCLVVELTCTSLAVRVAVTDEGGSTPPRVVDDFPAEHGRGLLLVRGLSVRTGVAGDHRGRTVWAEVALDSTGTAVSVMPPDAREAGAAPGNPPRLSAARRRWETHVTVLGMPQVPRRDSAAPDGGAVRFTAGHHIAVPAAGDLGELARNAGMPLSVIVQVTKRCDFDCAFCSETLRMRDPSLEQLAVVSGNLVGVQRVFLSGGEPLLRRDLVEVTDPFSGFIVGLPTNATRGIEAAPRLAGKIRFANIGFDGPQAIFRRVRGDYDKVLTGVTAFAEAGVPGSFSAVVLRSTLHGLPYLLQIADVVGAGKVKLVLPLRKGNALNLAEHEFITVAKHGSVHEHGLAGRPVRHWPAMAQGTPAARRARRVPGR